MDPNKEAENLKQERERLDYEKEIFALEKQKAALEQEKQRQELVTGQSEGIANAITTDESFGYFAELTAYQSFLDAARQMAEEVREQLEPGDRLLLTQDKQLLQPFTGYKLLQIQLQDWLNRMQLGREEGAEQARGVAPAPPQPKGEETSRSGGIAPFSLAATGVYGGLSVAADILKFFNYSTDIHSRDTKIKGFSLFAKIVERLTRSGIPDLQIHLEEHLRIPYTEAEGLLNTLEKTYQQAARLEERSLDPNDPLQEAAAQLLQSYRAYLVNLLAAPEGQPQSPITQALQQERMEKLGIRKILYIEVASSGGEALVRKGLLSFFRSGVTYLGGGVVSYTLADAGGSILCGDTLVARAVERQKF